MNDFFVVDIVYKIVSNHDIRGKKVESQYKRFYLFLFDSASGK